MARRPIYFRVTTGAPRPVHGVIRDLKTFNGATDRLFRLYPSAVEVVVQYDRFPGQLENGRTAAL